MERAKFESSPLLGGLEVLEATYEKQAFSRHTHEGYTVGVIRKGAQRFWRTGGYHVAPASSIILVNADQVHDGHSATEGGWTYEAMYPTEAQFESVSKDLGLASKVPYFPFAVEEDPKLSNQLLMLFSLLRSNEDPLLTETFTHHVLLSLTCRFNKRPQLPEDIVKIGPKLDLVREYLHQNATEAVSLEALSELSGVSPYHLVRQFKARYGLPPHAYQIQQRVRRAQHMMKNGFSLADCAISCGFHDQSHFHRHFRRAIGVTPKQYQKAILCNSSIRVADKTESILPHSDKSKDSHEQGQSRINHEE
ncbi:AraC family transcriptional regulator [Grimontia sp. S25]|uniref:AraC family transcriptional regulator n=1 Tax=Grimontia sedimenti TaxID=2711294 RepID=A0A6M1RBE2_9GAMM|nr:AraC family transcriptional regulator [Grimontia sedimenti]NGN97450.1 AraC family transcriptional regulator [Grimontia sedimenti]